MNKGAAAVGIGWRQPHYRELLARWDPARGPAASAGGAKHCVDDIEPPALDFIEVHSENFFGAGGASLGVLMQARERVDVSLHGVGLALGSAAGLDGWHLEQLAALVERVQPLRVSDHACFARAALQPGGPVLHGSDLLPIAFTPASLALMVAHVQQVQERLRRPLLVENLSAYLRWSDNSLAEPEFFNELARRSGCGLLLDLNNLVVNAVNDGAEDPAASAIAWLDALDAEAVGEIHLAGYDDSGPLAIDDHGSAVRAPVWRVYEHALNRLGPRPTLIEWDTALPPLDVLLGEAAHARGLMASCAVVSR